jgi:glycosyltransferase involved in cell wall biosynthesis
LISAISAIIPARNEEASIGRAVESVASQPEIAEVIVVNDQSTDGTGAILSELAARVPKLKVLSAGELPAGWTGKNYAASIGARAAHGDWLLFTDADTYHLPGSSRRALIDAAEHRAVLLSYSPEQEIETFGERMLIPVIYWRLSQHYSFERVNDPGLPDAAANGQYLLLQSDAYRAVGGHKAVANDILEDVALARRVKRAGYRIFFAPGHGVVRTRMYRSFGAMWQGWTKNLYPLMGGTLGSVLAEIAPLAGAAMLVPFAAYLTARNGASPWVLPLAVFAVICVTHLRYGVVLYRNRYPISLIKYCLLGLCLYSVALMVSSWKNTRGSVVWKGREYPARA